MLAIRNATVADEVLLWEMLYHAIFQPEGAPPLPPEVVRRPELSHYVAGWGAPGDIGLVAEADGQPIGAAWLRRLVGENRGYGFTDESVPELTLAVLPSHRGQGTGTELLIRLLAEASLRYPAVSLSVAAANPARHLYERLGFVLIREENESLTMIRYFAALTGPAITSA